MSALRMPWLLVAFVADLVALVVVTITAGADAATALELHTLAVGLGGAVAGAQLPTSHTGQ